MTILVVALFSAGFSAIKALPAYEYLHAYPHVDRAQEWNGAQRMLAGFFSRDQDYARAGLGRWSFHEYGAYVGGPCALLALIGIFSEGTRKWHWIVAGVGFLLLAAGVGKSAVAPASLLQALPFFSWQRIPTRFLVSAVLCVAALAGLGVDILRRRFGITGVLIAAGLIVAGVFDQWLLGPPNLRYAIERAESEAPPTHQFRHVWSATGHYLRFAETNTGTLHCTAFMPALPGAARGCNEAGYRGEQYLDGTGTLSLELWTPNLLIYNVDLASPASLIINQRYDRSWRLADRSGRVYRSGGGLLAVALGGGPHHLILEYQCLPFLAGAILIALSFPAMGILWLYETRWSSGLVDCGIGLTRRGSNHSGASRIGIHGLRSKI
jgi:hypothetical protein